MTFVARFKLDFIFRIVFIVYNIIFSYVILVQSSKVVAYLSTQTCMISLLRKYRLLKSLKIENILFTVFTIATVHQNTRTYSSYLTVTQFLRAAMSPSTPFSLSSSNHHFILNFSELNSCRFII